MKYFLSTDTVSKLLTYYENNLCKRGREEDRQRSVICVISIVKRLKCLAKPMER